MWTYIEVKLDDMIELLVVSNFECNNKLTSIVCILWRQNSDEIPTAESKTHQETEQKEEMTTGAVTGNDDDVNVSDNGDNIPNMSSPVAHLWTSNDDCRPLVRPEDATSTGMLHAQLDPTNFNLGISNFCRLFWTPTVSLGLPLCGQYWPATAPWALVRGGLGLYVGFLGQLGFGCQVILRLFLVQDISRWVYSWPTPPSWHGKY